MGVGGGLAIFEGKAEVAAISDLVPETGAACGSSNRVLGFRGSSLMNEAGRPGIPFALRTLPSPPCLHPSLHIHDTHTFRPSPSLAPFSEVMLAAVSMEAVRFEQGREGGVNAGSMQVRASQSKSWVRASQSKSWVRTSQSMSWVRQISPFAL